MTWKQSFLEAKSRLNDPRELCMSFMCSYDALQAVCLSTHYLVHWIVHVVWLLDLVLQKAWFFSSVHSYSWPNPHLCCILWGVIKRQVPSIEVDLRCIEYRCISYKLGTWFSTGFFATKTLPQMISRPQRFSWMRPQNWTEDGKKQLKWWGDADVKKKKLTNYKVRDYKSLYWLEQNELK